MRKKIDDEKIKEVLRTIIETGCTIRESTDKYNESKKKEEQIIHDTLYKYIERKLKKTDKELYQKYREVMETNKKERHIRGGEAKRKKEEIKNNK
ncbi:MAG: sporulation transcriptional regulator SpoIIID [Firmicutes bacterium]|nr:sporulation transcriptional regulator SpoIIID [Bacillota bacterium]